MPSNEVELHGTGLSPLHDWRGQRSRWSFGGSESSGFQFMIHGSGFG